jgi:hypothetical protein
MPVTRPTDDNQWFFSTRTRHWRECRSIAALRWLEQILIFGRSTFKIETWRRAASRRRLNKNCLEICRLRPSHCGFHYGLDGNCIATGRNRELRARSGRSQHQRQDPSGGHWQAAVLRQSNSLSRVTTSPRSRLEPGVQYLTSWGRNSHPQGFFCNKTYAFVPARTA